MSKIGPEGEGVDASINGRPRIIVALSLDHLIFRISTSGGAMLAEPSCADEVTAQVNSSRSSESNFILVISSPNVLLPRLGRRTQTTSVYYYREFSFESLNGGQNVQESGSRISYVLNP